MARRIRAFLTLLGLLAVAACGGVDRPAESPPALQWTAVDLPESMNPRSLAISGPDLLIGGRSSVGGDHPVLAAVAGDGAARPVPLKPNSPYAKVADLVSLDANGTEVVALGAAHGGAHSNFRWTVWQGTAEGLVEYPQTFETFGGTSAGALADIVLTADGPVIVGTWSPASGKGLDAAVWLPRGDRWVRQPSAGTPLANTDRVQVGPRSAAADGRAALITGSLITLGNGLQQTAAVWTWPSRSGEWSVTRLPDAGKRSEALAARCLQLCWVSGYVDGQVALWQAGTGEQPVRESLPGGLPVEGGTQTLLTPDGRPGVVFSKGARSTLAVKSATGWSTFAAPDGTVRDATAVGDQVYLIVGADPLATRLWSVQLS
jgi:hypothetical protein